MRKEEGRREVEEEEQEERKKRVHVPTFINRKVKSKAVVVL